MYNGMNAFLKNFYSVAKAIYNQISFDSIVPELVIILLHLLKRVGIDLMLKLLLR